jgi:hypothetical protein
VLVQGFFFLQVPQHTMMFLPAENPTRKFRK